MATFHVTEDEMKKFKEVSDVLHQSGVEAAKQKIKDLNLTVPPKAPGVEPIGGCVPCAACPVKGNPAFIIAYGYLA